MLQRNKRFCDLKPHNVQALSKESRALHFLVIVSLGETEAIGISLDQLVARSIIIPR